ncbi:MAG: 1-acyl-sn-glycerol-3-phosphate acyltransferase [Sulfuricella sp.]|nr:1-acyl-sn-glycerol-3-phosphate acyltransferase [Sulfuricella sp.]
MPHPLTHKPANRWLWRVIGRLAFNRIAVVGTENLPAEGPVLFVATHRNGALDAAPYTVAAPTAVPMVSAQLHRIPLGRFLFRGIAVARGKDRGRGIEADNGKALQDCIRLLRAGSRLFVMPEGTSTLGPKHQPYHRGAARIARAAMDAGAIPTIVPVGVHYEDPTVWQSRVEVLVGEPIHSRPEDTVADLHRRIVQGLESAGANFTDEESQRTAEMLAYASTLGTDISYARALKSFEAGIPRGLAESVRQLQQLARLERLSLHQGVPLVPIGSWLPYAAYWLMLAPVVLLFVLSNLPVLAAGYTASRKLPDAPNVISFWRMAIGLPVGVAWAAMASLALAIFLGAAGVLAYGAVTLGGIMAWYRFRKLSVALRNALFHAGAKPALLHAYRNLFGVQDDRAA